MAKTRDVVKDVIIVVVGVAAIWIGLQVIFGTQNPFYVVSSGSMIPVLQVYDVLVVNGNVPFEDIKKGDIIVFNRPNGHDRVIVHRVDAILDDRPASKTIRTKGDANPISIPGTDYPITKQEYIGKVFYVVPQIGYVTRVLAPPINYIIIAVIVGIMIVKQFTQKTKKEPKFETDLPKEEPKEKPKDEFAKQDDTTYSELDSKKEPKEDFTKQNDTPSNESGSKKDDNENRT